MKLAVSGTGYVGLSIATLLAQHHEVMAVDIIEDKVNKINNRISPIQDEYIEKYLKEKNLKPQSAGYNVLKRQEKEIKSFDEFETEIYLDV